MHGDIERNRYDARGGVWFGQRTDTHGGGQHRYLTERAVRVVFEPFGDQIAGIDAPRHRDPLRSAFIAENELDKERNEGRDKNRPFVVREQTRHSADQQQRDVQDTDIHQPYAP